MHEGASCQACQGPLTKVDRAAAGTGRVVLQTAIGGEWLLREFEDDPLPRMG